MLRPGDASRSNRNQLLFSRRCCYGCMGEHYISPHSVIRTFNFGLYMSVWRTSRLWRLTDYFALLAYSQSFAPSTSPPLPAQKPHVSHLRSLLEHR